MQRWIFFRYICIMKSYAMLPLIFYAITRFFPLYFININAVVQLWHAQRKNDVSTYTSAMSTKLMVFVIFSFDTIKHVSLALYNGREWVKCWNVMKYWQLNIEHFYHEYYWCQHFLSDLSTQKTEEKQWYVYFLRWTCQKKANLSVWVYPKTWQSLT